MATVHPKISEERPQTIVSSTKNVTLRIKRSNPEVSSEERFDELIVPVEKWTTVLDALLDAKSHLDHSIGIRYSNSDFPNGIYHYQIGRASCRERV